MEIHEPIIVVEESSKQTRIRGRRRRIHLLIRWAVFVSLFFGGLFTFTQFADQTTLKAIGALVGVVSSVGLILDICGAFGRLSRGEPI